jgi:D-3-phosphoglycerate dehydrogenase / 2-oxoglutarate reductase
MTPPAPAPDPSPAPRVLVADPLSREGIELLREAGAEVLDLSGSSRAEIEAAIAGCDALVVRSRTKVDSRLLEAGTRLKVVGRAGTGVDNVDVKTATRRGVLVLNAPNANLTSATEHSFAMLLALARSIATADASMKRGEWDRKSFLGRELHGKTLGIVGLGRIGQRVAARARAFEMQVAAFDPWLAPAVAERLGVELLPLDDLLARADILTLHLPLTAETRNLLNAERLERLRPGALVVNCSRGGVIDEAALLAALESGRVGGAALDVFAEEPPRDRRLAAHPRVVATPHIGAQTREAQERVSVEICRMVLDALAGSLEVSAVNLPFTTDGSLAGPYLVLGEQLGRLASSLASGRLRRVQVDLWGIDERLRVPVAMAAAKGALEPFLGEAVNYVNVEWLARERGVELVRTIHHQPGDYSQQVGVAVTGGEETDGGGDAVALRGTLFGERQPRVVRLGNHPLEFRLEGRLLVLKSWDVPGVVGKVGTTLGALGINIADIHLARKDGEPDAWTVLRLDQDPTPEVLDGLAALPEIRRVHPVDLRR